MPNPTISSPPPLVTTSNGAKAADLAPAPAEVNHVSIPPEPGRLRARKNISRPVKRIGWAVIAGSLATAITFGLRSDPVGVETAVANRGTLLVTVDEDGRTRVKDRYLVSAPLAGTVRRVGLKPGDSVAQGAIVARLAPVAPPLLDPRARAESQARVAAARSALRQAGTTVERARAAYTLARHDAERQRALLREGATAPQMVEQAETAQRMRQEEVASAEFGQQVAASELRLSQAALARIGAPAREEFLVRAPVSGHVLRVLQESEAAVQPGTPLLEIGNPLALEVVVDVLTTDAVHIRPGAAVRIDRWGGDSTLSGHLHRVEPSAFTRLSALGVEEQRVNVIIDLDSPRSAPLGDGYRVEASIAVWQGKDRLIVPGGAVFRQGEGWATYVVENGRAYLRPLQLGRRNTAAVEVLGGLRQGERVVLYPTDNVNDGVRAEVR
ncbi:MAG TPA: efflux RND transporter periplasmic adaptor subunit [Gemmatimonadales bacterium]